MTNTKSLIDYISITEQRETALGISWHSHGLMTLQWESNQHRRDDMSRV